MNALGNRVSFFLFFFAFRPSSEGADEVVATVKWTAPHRVQDPDNLSTI